MTSTKLKQQELLQSQTNAQETHKQNSGEHLIEQGQIQGWPFKWIKKDEEFILVFGKYKINDRPLISIEDIHAYIELETGNIFMKMSFIIAGDAIEAYERKLAAQHKQNVV